MFRVFATSILIMACAVVFASPASGADPWPFLTAQLEAPEDCQPNVFSTREVVGAFQWTECGDFCHLALAIDGEEVQFLVAGDAQDFEAEEGAMVRAIVNDEQFPNPFDTGCLRTDVVTSIERVR